MAGSIEVDLAGHVERELKKRVFERVVPCLAKGFLADRARRLGIEKEPDDQELETIRQGTLTLLYRILFLLYAESRDLLPVREAPYFELSLKKIANEIAERAGSAEPACDETPAAHFSMDECALYLRLAELCAVIDAGDSAVNVPAYHGELFRTTREGAGDGFAAIARFLHEHRVPDLHLAAAIDHLARLPNPRQNLGLAVVDYKALGVRQLGSIYEGLLEYKLFIADEDLVEVKKKSKIAFKPLDQIAKPKRGRKDLRIIRRGDVYLATDKTERRATGSYYTPENIVQYIVAHTIGPVLQRKLDALVPEFRKAERTFHLELVEKIFDLKVLDPAMGSGHFLVAAVDFITDQLVVWLDQFRPFNPMAAMLERTRQRILDTLNEQGVSIDADCLPDVHLLKRHVLKRCIYGVDLNPLATELAKMSLWLDAFALGESLSFLDHHLRAGDSLMDATLDEFSEGESAFDCVVGNPPYLGHKGDVDGETLRRRFRVCRDYANLATAFAELACTHVKPLGAVGLLVPKSIQYVDAWEAARRLIAVENRLEHLIDVSEAFADVLLEQSIFICSRRSPASVYCAGAIGADGALSHAELPVRLLSTLGCLPARIEARSLGLLAHVSKIGASLGSISQTAQALGYQAMINRDVTGRSKPILRGKQVRPLRLDAPTDWIDESFLRSRRGNGFTDKVNQMLRPKVVSQNIVAHVTLPKPRIWIISAPDTEGLICLNTVSTTVIANPDYDARYISLILNSSLSSWFYYEFVFCRAVRTMHFDQYYAGKLPIPRIGPRLLSSLPGLTDAAAAESSRSRRQRLIDDFVFTAYVLDPIDRAFVVDYCYGPGGYAALEEATLKSDTSLTSSTSASAPVPRSPC